MKIIKRLKKCYPKALHLLNKEWRDINKNSKIPSTGFCYIATEALFHLLEDKNNYTPYCATYYEGKRRCTHWWLKHKKSGLILDPTDCQYDEEVPPYHLGRGMGFQNGYSKPSKRAKALIDIYDCIY